MDEITNFKCQSGSDISRSTRTEWESLLFGSRFCFCVLHIMEPLCGVMCSYYVERDSFRVSLGRRCCPTGQLPSDSWPAGASLTIQTRLDVTHPVFCYPGLGLIDRSFIITKSVTRSRAGAWIMFQCARLCADPGSRGSQPSRRGLKRSRAVIGQEMGGELWLVETNRWMFPLASRAW